jgi:putative mRNA 3-end processing factor
VFLTGATNDTYRAALTESVRTICERAGNGSPVLVSASGLTAVRYAYLLSHLADHLERSLPVTVAGHAAKLYDDLGYEIPHVETVATFDDPEELLAPGRVTVAGPGSSH